MAIGQSWSFPLPVLGAMLGCCGAYFVLWRRAGALPGRLLAFAAGMLALGLAVFSPIDRVGECCLLSVHMVQHSLLLLAAPALLLWGLVGVVGRAGGRTGRLLAWVTRPAVALSLLLANLYLWHIPAAYQAALLDKPLHDAEHLLYFFTGLVYFWAIFDPVPLPAQPLSYGRKLAYLLVGSVAMMPLGLLIMWWPGPLYPHYVAAAQAAGQSAGQSAVYDQQYAALVMLASGGFLLAAALLAGLHLLSGGTAVEHGA